MSDNNSDKKGKSGAARLFGAMGLDPQRYSHNTRSQREAEAEASAESRWPLLGELRESLEAQEADQSSYTPAREPEPTQAPETPPMDRPATPDTAAAQVAAQDTPASPEQAAPEEQPDVAYDTPDIAQDTAADTVEAVEGAAATDKTDAEPAPASPATAAKEPGPSLAEVFGLDDAQGAQADSPAPPATPPREPTAAATEARAEREDDPERENLQNLFARLGGREQPAPEPEKRKPTGLAAIFDRLRGK